MLEKLYLVLDVTPALAAAAAVVVRSHLPAAVLILFSGTWRLQNSVSLSLTLTWTLLSYTWHLLIIAILASLFSRTINSTKPNKSTSQKHNKDDKKSSKLSDKKSAGLEKISAIRKSTKSKCMPSEKPSYHIRIERSVMSSDSSEEGSEESSSPDTARCQSSSEDTSTSSGSSLDRISPLEEFNTLYRNKDAVRASIKLKESNVI